MMIFIVNIFNLNNGFKNKLNNIAIAHQLWAKNEVACT